MLVPQRAAALAPPRARTRRRRAPAVTRAGVRTLTRFLSDKCAAASLASKPPRCSPAHAHEH
jgi:hypothetical protein